MRQRSHKTQLAILDASRRQFLGHASYDATSMDDIAAAAGVTKQTLYGYYANKEALCIATMEHLVDAPWNHDFPPSLLASVYTPAELRQVLRTVLSRVVDKLFQADYLNLMRLVFAESKRRPSLGRLFKERVPERALGGMSKLLEVAVDRGLLSVDPQMGARMVIGSLLTFAIVEGLLEDDVGFRPSAEQLERIAEQIMK